MSTIRKYHNHKPRTTPWHREEELEGVSLGHQLLKEQQITHVCVNLQHRVKSVLDLHVSVLDTCPFKIVSEIVQNFITFYHRKLYIDNFKLSDIYYCLMQQEDFERKMKQLKRTI